MHARTQANTSKRKHEHRNTRASTKKQQQKKTSRPRTHDQVVLSLALPATCYLSSLLSSPVGFPSLMADPAPQHFFTIFLSTNLLCIFDYLDYNRSLPLLLALRCLSRCLPHYCSSTRIKLHIGRQGPSRASCDGSDLCYRKTGQTQ